MFNQSVRYGRETSSDYMFRIALELCSDSCVVQQVSMWISGTALRGIEKRHFLYNLIGCMMFRWCRHGSGLQLCGTFSPTSKHERRRSQTAPAKLLVYNNNFWRVVEAF